MKLVKILFVLLFIVSLVVDNINGYLQIQRGIHSDVGIVMRLTVLLICLPSLLKHKHVSRFLIFFVVAFVISILIWSSRNSVNIPFEISSVSKYLYVYFLYAFFSQYWKKMSYNYILNYVTIYALIISTILLCCYALDIGNSTYGGGNYGWGTKGFFKAGNDLGLTMILSLSLACINYFKYNSSTLNFFFITYISFCSILIGSRVCFIMVPAIYIPFCLFLFFSKGKTLSLAMIVLLFMFFLPKMITYIYNQFDTWTIERMTIVSLQNARIGYTELASNYIDSFDGVSFLVGNGLGVYLTSLGSVFGLEAKSAEADFYDVVGPYGYLLGGMLMFFYFFCIFYAFTKYLRKKDRDNLVYFFMFIFFVLIGLLSGHAFSNVLSAPLYAIIAVRTFKQYDCMQLQRSNLKVRK